MSTRIKGGSFLSSVAIYGASNGLSALAPFLLLPILTSYLTQDEFGRYSMFLFLVGVLTVIVGVNIHGSISVNFFKYSKKKFAQYVGSCFVLVVLSFLLIFLVLTFTGSFIAHFLKVNEGLVRLAAVIGLFNIFYLSCLAILQASDKPFKFLQLKLAQTAIDIVVTVVLVVFFVMGLEGRVNAYNLAILICSFFAIWIIARGGFIKFRAHQDHIVKALSFGLPLLPHALSGSLIMFVDRVVITKVIDTSATGIYMAGLQVSMVMMLFIEPINKAYTPWLFKRLSAGQLSSKTDLVKYSYLYFFGLLMLGFILYLVNDLLFHFLVDEKFYDAKSLMLFLYLGFAFQGMYYAVTNYVFFVEKTGVLSMVSLFTAGLGSALSYILVSSYGLRGASIAFMLTNMLLFFMVWILAAKFVPMPWLSFYKKVIV